MLSLFGQAKYFLPCLVALSGIGIYYALGIFREFQPIISDTLAATQQECFFIIATPPAYTGDFEAQMAPMDLLLQRNMDTSRPLQNAALAAAEMFVDEDMDGNGAVSVASPVECSLQLYHIEEEPPRPDDMWTARGVLVKTSSFQETQQLTQELQTTLPHNLTLQAINFGPGPFVAANHSIVEGQASFFLSFLVTEWVEALIAMHQQVFDFQDKFVVLRVMVMSKNAQDHVTLKEHVIMKPDSLDVYEQIHPGDHKDSNPQQPFD
eukprot:Sro601_g173520.1 n/a (265) ;mRNA; r:26523-27317